MVSLSPIARAILFCNRLNQIRVTHIFRVRHARARRASTESSGTATMDSLPEEVVVNIGRYLEPREVARMRLLASRYSRIGLDPQVRWVETLDLEPGAQPPHSRYVNIRQKVTRLSDVHPDVTYLTLDLGVEYGIREPIDLRHLTKLKEVTIRAPVAIGYMPSSAVTLAVYADVMRFVFPEISVNLGKGIIRGYVLQDRLRVVDLGAVTTLIVINASDEVPILSNVPLNEVKGFEISSVRTLRHVTTRRPAPGEIPQRMIGRALGEQVIAARITHEVESLIGPAFICEAPCRVFTIQMFAEPIKGSSRFVPRWHPGSIHLPFVTALALSGDSQLFLSFLHATLGPRPERSVLTALALSSLGADMATYIAGTVPNLRVLFLPKYLESENVQVRDTVRIVYVDDPTAGMLDFLRKTEFGRSLIELPLVGVPNYGYDFSGW